MSPMKPIETVEDALRTVVYLSGWSLTTDAQKIMEPDAVDACYEAALNRTKGLVLSRARLLQAWDVLNAHGMLR